MRILNPSPIVRTALIALVAGILLASGVARADEPSDIETLRRDLRITAYIDRTAASPGGHTDLFIVFRNAGGAALTLPTPSLYDEVHMQGEERAGNVMEWHSPVPNAIVTVRGEDGQPVDFLHDVIEKEKRAQQFIELPPGECHILVARLEIQKAGLAVQEMELEVDPISVQRETAYFFAAKPGDYQLTFHFFPAGLTLPLPAEENDAPARLSSDAVTLRIKAAEQAEDVMQLAQPIEAPTEWSQPKAGLRLRIVADDPSVLAGKDLDLLALIQNVSDAPITLPAIDLMPIAGLAEDDHPYINNNHFNAMLIVSPENMEMQMLWPVLEVQKLIRPAVELQPGELYPLIFHLDTHAEMRVHALQPNAIVDELRREWVDVPAFASGEGEYEVRFQYRPLMQGPGEEAPARVEIMSDPILIWLQERSLEDH